MTALFYVHELRIMILSVQRIMNSGELVRDRLVNEMKMFNDTGSVGVE